MFNPGAERGSLVDAAEAPIAKPAFRYASIGNTPAATPTDVLTLTGSATKTIRVRRIWVSGLAGTAGLLTPRLVRRAAANTGGTSTAPTPMKMDTADAAATGVLALYTANPTINSTVGTLGARALFLNLATAGKDAVEWEFPGTYHRGLVLRGALDILAVNFAGAAVPAGGLLDFELEWTEL